MGLVTAALMALAWHVLSAGGWSAWEALILLCLAANAPWVGLSAATGLVGAALRLGGGPAAPAPRAPLAPEPRTLLAVCVRDEPMEEVLPPLERLLEGLAPRGDRYVAALLSDTADPTRAAEEEAAVSALAARHPGRVLYRRRARNEGFKAGNVMEFLDRHAGGFELALMLDADSEMSAGAVLRMVERMRVEPRLALLQSTIAGRPADSRFGRLFGAGHRPGSLTWATGQGWWQEEEGPYWGHNALVRIAPFRAHCRLGPLPDGSPILSHDHVEAARLHGAGWAVRVLPDEGGSREAHPPNLPEFLARDRRWAAGNLQYRHLLRDPSLGPLGRFQMLQAILHYLLSPLWFALLPLAALNAATGGAEGTPRGALLLLLLLGYAALHAPRLLGHLEILLRAAPGGRWRALRTALAESVFTLLFDSLSALDKTLTVLAHALGLRRAGWPAQHRRARRVGWGEAARRLWPHGLAGVAVLGLLLASGSGFAVLAGLPAAAGLLLAVPFCVLTSAPEPRAS